MCMSCGICVGACPTATPFRRAGDRCRPGIELPDRTVAGLRDEVVAAAAKLHRVHARSSSSVAAHDAGSQPLGRRRDRGREAAMRRHAAALVPRFRVSRRATPTACCSRAARRTTATSASATGGSSSASPASATRTCGPGCRASASPSPGTIRRRAPAARIAGTVPRAPARPWSGRAWAQARAAPERLIRRLARASARPGRGPLRWAGQACAYAALVAADRLLRHAARLHQPAGDHALLKLSFSHAGQPLKPCRRFTHEELTSTRFSERQRDQLRARPLAGVRRVRSRRQPLYRGTHEPAGLWNDGPSSVYLRFEVPAGHHR